MNKPPGNVKLIIFEFNSSCYLLVFNPFACDEIGVPLFHLLCDANENVSLPPHCNRYDLRNISVTFILAMRRLTNAFKLSKT